MKMFCRFWLLASVLVACADNPVEVAETPERIDLSGVWDFTEVLFRTNQPVICRDTGSYWLSNEHNSLAGAGEKVGTCEGLVDDFSDARTFTVRDGVVRDTFVEFVITGACGLSSEGPLDARYTGTISRGPPLRMSGSSACSVNFNGLWEAAPAEPTASIRLRPDTASMMLHETIYLQPIMRSANGARQFERDLTWTSGDTSVAVVGADGAVFATGVGTTTIEVSGMGRSAGASLTTRSVSFASVEAGTYHTCGLSEDGDAYCWGANESGQSGPSPSLAPCPGVLCRQAPGAVLGPARFSIVNGGEAHTCGIAHDGSAYCWGSNSVGQLGVGQVSGYTQTPQLVVGGHTFSWMSAGGGHVCGVAEAGLAYCWGSNIRGQAGPNPTDPGTEPYLVSSSLAFTTVHAGRLHSCGLAVDGTSHCWGWNWNSQLGNDTIPASAEPLVVSDVLFSSMTVGASHNCGLTAEGMAYCWGDGDWGQLGMDSIDYVATPTAVAGDLEFSSISAGTYHTCALTLGGAAYCWGEGSYGRLGNGSTADAFAPVAVAGGLTFVSITAGAEHTCGMADDGFAYCWGSNFNGQLGQSGTAPSAVPLKVIGQL